MSYGTAKLVKIRGVPQWKIEAIPSVMLRLRRLFRGTDRAAKSVTISDTLESCRDLAWVLDRWPLELQKSDLSHLLERAGRHKENQDIISRMLSADYEPRDFTLELPPRPYQRIAADMALRMRELLLADDVGLGKTISAIAALSDPSTRPALVVTLTHLPRQWEEEINRFAPAMWVHRIRGGPMYDLTKPVGRGVRRRRKGGQGELDLIPRVGGRLPDVVVTSYSKLSKWVDALAGAFKGVVFDEVQELRRVGSQKYGAASRIAESADFRMGLSATPIYNYGGEMYAVLNVLSPGALGTWSEFASTWCSGFMERQKARLKNPQGFSLWTRESGLMLRRTRRDVARELPGLSRIVHRVDTDSRPLSDVEGRAAELARVILSDASGIEQMKARGELDWRLRQATGIAKAPYCADFVRLLLESGEGKVLVYAWHHDVYDIIEERLCDIELVRYTGKESEAAKHRAKKAFVESDARVMLISLRSGAGLDGLQKVCRTVVFAELDWSPGVHEQCSGRIYRDGQPDPVAAYYLVSEEGSDPIVMDVLGVKYGQVEGIRQPEGDLMEKSEVDPERIRKLAERYLRGKRTKAA